MVSNGSQELSRLRIYGMLRVFNFRMDDLEKAEYYINATETEYDLVSISITPITNMDGIIEYHLIMVGREKAIEYMPKVMGE